METCNKCGLLPQQPAKPCPRPRCVYKRKRCCCRKKCCNQIGTYFVPSTLGDDLTGEYKAAQGLFENMVVTYEANGAKYIYDTNGVYTKL